MPTRLSPAGPTAPGRGHPPAEPHARRNLAVALADLGRFDELNAAYVAAFGEHRPARSAVGVAALPLGAEVEIEAIARSGAAG